MRFPATTAIAALAVLAACADQPTAPGSPSAPSLAASAPTRSVGINVLLRGAPSSAQLAQLRSHGMVFDVLPEINAVIMRGQAGDLPAIRALPFVSDAEVDTPVRTAPVDVLPLDDFAGGLSTWNLDAINVTSGPGTDRRVVPFTGEGVYVGVLDSGLLSSWSQYFPSERIAAEYATTFIGGGALDQGNTPSPPGMWQRDQNSHGTHVVSTIIGYRLDGSRVPGGSSLGVTHVDGVAPRATIIPVKVLNQNGSGWWSAIAQGIVYVARLKQGELAGHPMVINMSLGGGGLAPVARAAIDYAIGAGVIIVASAGNAGEAGMGYPGAYPPVISAAAIGWVDQWATADWWYALDVPDPTDPDEFFIASFSSRALAGQDLDVSAPGVQVLGPYQTNSGHLAYNFLGGTSMASPHVAGVVALMAERDPTLTASSAEMILENTAAELAPGCRTGIRSTLNSPPNITRCWGANAAGAGLVQADAATGTPLP
ncbi:MAG: S8 family peptidase [Gemmatimonadaceae bacterium]